MLPLARPFGVAFLLFALALPVSAHESNQYVLPTGRELAEMGDFFTRYFYDAIDEGVKETNDKIRLAVDSGRRGEALDQLRSPEEVTRAVNRQFPFAYPLIHGLDELLTSPEMRRKYPDRLAGYQAPPTAEWYLAFPINPLRAGGCASVKIHGVQMGTDKIGHFTDMGMHYWQTYTGYTAKGDTEEVAIRKAVAVGMDDPIKGESKILGFWTTGAYSNADLVANYMGMVFYRNLTEPQSLKGQMRPPMLIREGQYWKIAPHIRRDSDFFAWFISDHLDEAQNPSLYIEHTRSMVRGIATKHIDGTLENRRDRWGNRRSQAWFTANTQAMRTYWGFDYGHRGAPGELIRIEDVCFAAPSNPNRRDAVGRTALHRAVAADDQAAVRRLLDAGADVNEPVRSNEGFNSNWGDTPLHMAAQDGRAEMVRLLISRGADVSRANDRGNTPLHRAVPYPNIMAALLDAGAPIALADAQGRTPLHWAAMGEQGAIRLLLDRKADINARDHRGQTALHYAARWDGRTIPMLLARGADVNAQDRFGASPLHVAAAANQPYAIASLVDGGAIVNAPDHFGITPLADATQRRAGQVVAMLRDAGASPEPQTASFRR